LKEIIEFLKNLKGLIRSGQQEDIKTAVLVCSAELGVAKIEPSGVDAVDHAYVGIAMYQVGGVISGTAKKGLTAVSGTYRTPQPAADRVRYRGYVRRCQRPTKPSAFDRLKKLVFEIIGT
jgi:hypothetical protein